MSQDINEKLQTANDMLQAVERQRNHALNECVALAAELAKLQRRIADLEKAQEPKVPQPFRNGHDHVEEARA